MEAAIATNDAPATQQQQQQPSVASARRRNRAKSRAAAGGDGSEGSNNTSTSPSTSRKESLGGALARATLGSLAFFFRLPIRLFRPVKLSSWTVLESFAKREKKTLSLRYILRLLRRENNSFIFHLLGPPILFNTLIGFTLFESYSITEARLLRRHRPDLLEPPAQDDEHTSRKATWTPLWIVTVAGAAAGAAQCILSAPLDNVRLVLTSHKQPSKRSVGRRTGGSQQHRHAAHISWRSIFRAALLPFAPSQARGKLVKAVRDAKDEHVRAGQAGSSSSASNSYFNKEQRRLWQQKLKRLGGSVHGAGLVMSLCRDSIGFASFFLIFEVSRRAAHGSSTAIDRSIAWWSTKATMPSPQLPQRDTTSSSSDEEEDDFYHAQAQRADLSYSSSRTKTGRVVAALVLIVGGAIGAFAYEAVGRPFELMRLIIWQGRQQWQRAREAQARRKRAGGGRSLRRARLSASASEGGTKRATRLGLAAANSSSSRLESLLTLRVANSAGSRLSRLQAVLSQSHPPHPLRRRGKSIVARKAGVIKCDTGSASGGDEVFSRSSHRKAAEKNATPAGHQPVARHPPSALALLLNHAERTSTLAYTSSSRKFRTAVPSSVLLAHTYFIAPYLGGAGGGEAAAPLQEATASGDTKEEKEAKGVGGKEKRSAASTGGRLSPSTPSATTRSAARLLSNWINKNPVSSSSFVPSLPSQRSSSTSTSTATSAGASRGGLRLGYLFPRRPQDAPGGLGSVSQARQWGTGRAAWALRRLASPYGVGFVIFAWMSGDV